MEKSVNQFEDLDPWRKAILAERKKAGFRQILKNALDQYEGPRDNALILGDASLVQSKFFLEQEKFAHVVDVDSSPTLLDDDIISKDDTRVERVLSEFDLYEPGDQKFDVIYGKSIAFNPKESIEKVLKSLHDALNTDGVFYAEWAGEGDNFGRISYDLEELKNLYTHTGFVIKEIREIDDMITSLLGRLARKHEFRIVADKK